MRSKKNTNNYIHRKLIKDCKKGNSKAQFEVYKLYYQAMYNTSLRIVNNTLEAEDIMQEAFLKAFNNLDQYKGEVSFGAWLKKIVVNRSLDFLRQKKMFFESFENNSSAIATEEKEDWDYLPDIELIKKEIKALPDGYRIILSLYLLEGYDHNEIAQILDITASTSRSQFARAKKKLREKLKKKDDNE